MLENECERYLKNIILLGDFNAETGMEKEFQLTVGSYQNIRELTKMVKG